MHAIKFTENVSDFDDDEHMNHVGEFSSSEYYLSGDRRTFLVSQ